MNATPSAAPRVVGPVVQFTLLIVPVVMNGFFLVYALTGWVLEGRDHFNWSLEAPEVAGWVGFGIVVYAVLVGAYVRFSGGRWSHPLVLSRVAHGTLALLLIVSVLLASRS